MKRRFLKAIGAAFLALLTTPALLTAASSIDSSTITQVVKNVSVLQPGKKVRKSAQVNDVFSTPEIMRTGPDSRAEMIAPDQTVTRVGANTIFSFEPESREINLQKGSILFNSPTGKGGGTIKTAAATASVLGTTLIVVTTDNGGFKVLLMEGTGRVKTPKGRFRTLKAGQLVFALPGGDLSQVLTFQLSQQVGASLLVGGFKKPLPSIAKIEAAIAKQEKMIAKGQLQETGLLAGNEADKAFKVDPNSREVLIREERGGGGGVDNALSSDAIIDAPSLEQERVFALNLGIAGIDGTTTNIALPPDFSVFYAANTTIQTPTIDLSPYTGTFVFVSLGDFIFEQGVSLVGGQGLSLYFIAGNTLRQQPGTTLTADSTDLNIFALGSGPAFGGSSASSGIIWNDFAVTNTGNVFLSAPSASLFDTDLISSGGNLSVSTSGDFSIEGIVVPIGTVLRVVGASGDVDFSIGGNYSQIENDVVGNNINISADGNIAIRRSFLNRFGSFPGYTEKGGSGELTSSSVSLSAGGSLAFTQTFIEALNVSLSGASVNITQSELNTISSVKVSTSGNVTGNGNQIFSRSTQISGGQTVAINASDFHPAFNSSGPGTVSSVSISARNLLGVNATNFNVTDVSLAAQTIVLRDVAFQSGSRVSLDSASGRLAPNPNTNRPVSLGDVNFIQNVTYSGFPAQNAVSGGSIIIR